MISAGIMVDGRTVLVEIFGHVNAQAYIMDIMNDLVILAAIDIGPYFLLRHENMTAYSAQDTRNHLQGLHISVMECGQQRA